MDDNNSSRTMEDREGGSTSGGNGGGSMFIPEVPPPPTLASEDVVSVNPLVVDESQEANTSPHPCSSTADGYSWGPNEMNDGQQWAPNVAEIAARHHHSSNGNSARYQGYGGVSPSSAGHSSTDWYQSPGATGGGRVDSSATPFNLHAHQQEAGGGAFYSSSAHHASQHEALGYGNPAQEATYLTGRASYRSTASTSQSAGGGYISSSAEVSGANGGGGENLRATNLRLRPHSTPATLCWLERNYELADGVCIPRNAVYCNYVDFCSKNGMQPVNAASFGKIIRQMFQSLTTRRLGTRGQSRYHYYGLAVKPESIYYTPNYSSRKSVRSPGFSHVESGRHPSGNASSHAQWEPIPKLELPAEANKSLHQHQHSASYHHGHHHQQDSSIGHHQHPHSHHLHHLQSQGSHGTSHHSVGPSSSRTGSVPNLANTGKSNLQSFGGEWSRVLRKRSSEDAAAGVMVGGNGGLHLRGGSASDSMTPVGYELPPAASGFAYMQQLPPFPGHTEFIRLSGSTLAEDHFQTLITMYRAHAQRVMDSVNKFSFNEIPELFRHFWQELPSHIAGSIGHPSVVKLICVCDSILYNAIVKAILPDPFKMLPEDIIGVVRNFADDLVSSLQDALKHIPQNLTTTKIRLARHLSRCLRRRTSVNHLFKAASLMINPSNFMVYNRLQSEFQFGEWDNVIKQIADSGDCAQEDLEAIGKSFYNLLEEQATVEEFCQWISGLFEGRIRHITKTGSNQYSNLRACRRFLCSWNKLLDSFFDRLQENSSPLELSRNKSPTSLHFVRILYNEIVCNEIEKLALKESLQEVLLAKGDQLDNPEQDLLLQSLGMDFLSTVKSQEAKQQGTPSPRKELKMEKL